MKALTFSQFGGPEVLEYTEVPEPLLKEGEVLVELKAIGLNYADVYRRQGAYHLMGDPPYIAGYEGAGVVIDANGVDDIYTGDRVAFADVPFANAELVAVPHEHLIPLPENISFETAASSLLQGLTAHYLTSDSYRIRAEETVLIHACAGGVGQLLVQICKAKDAYVIGLTSSDEKRAVALDLGADEVFLYNENWTESLASKNIAVVYESVGTTLLQSVEVVREGGTIVFFGFAGGAPPCINPRLLMDGSKTITGGDLWTYLNSKEERISRSASLFDWIETGIVSIAPSATFALEDGAEAHRFLESRKSTGKIILIP
ncbi:MAG: Alcohol dehydrogenase, zinc-binding domain protein [Flavisolibacter sp.]|jgi:NADPH2:quinone reductase|nr:Alcohol dehydrogenase, zinc-binding domain protein [Flavisolibacter sp.]